MGNKENTGYARNGEGSSEISRKELEAALGNTITDSMFEEALNYARRKQEYIYQLEKRDVVLQRWYFLEIMKECIRNIAFSKFTMDLCMEICNTEKEHLDETGAQQKNTL